MNENGEHRCEKTGSKRIRAPRWAPAGVGSSRRKHACPSHVAFICFGLAEVTPAPSKPHVGVCFFSVVSMSLGIGGCPDTKAGKF